MQLSWSFLCDGKMTFAVADIMSELHAVRGRGEGGKGKRKL